jgi:glycosyltransferase involved in cell wall biosynthesis
MMPKVSVICNTYNHEAYISQCLDGFLAQQTDFDVEFLIHDDASTDQTPSIIKDYARRYPGKFNILLQTENQFSMGLSIIDLNMARANGEYIAVCDGDDYWCDPLKLQRQVDYMDTHPDCTLHVHAYRIILARNPSIHLDRFYTTIEIDVTLHDILTARTTPFAHNTYLFRHHNANYGTAYRLLGYVDLPRLIYSATIGEVHYSPIIQSVYRSGVAESYVMRNTAKPKTSIHQLRRRIEFYTALVEEIPQEREILELIVDELKLNLFAKLRQPIQVIHALKKPGFPLTPKRWLVILGDLCFPYLMYAIRRYRRLYTLPGGIR